jgi:hypothetical protein
VIPLILKDVAVGLDGSATIVSGGTAHAGARSGGTVCRWGRRMVVTRCLMIGLFEFKFDHLNMNLTV